MENNSVEIKKTELKKDEFETILENLTPESIEYCENIARLLSIHNDLKKQITTAFAHIVELDENNVKLSVQNDFLEQEKEGFRKENETLNQNYNELKRRMFEITKKD